MGNCAEDTARKYEISRLEQDEYAKRSYMNTARASESGVLGREIVSVTIPQKKGKPDVVVKHDEEYMRYMYMCVCILFFSFLYYSLCYAVIWLIRTRINTVIFTVLCS